MMNYLILLLLPLVAFLLLLLPHSVAAQAATITCDESTPDWSSLVNWTSDLRTAATEASLPSITCPNNSNTNNNINIDSTTTTSWSNKRVLLIGVDGLRADAAAMLPLPNLHRLQQLGTHSFWSKVQSTASAVSGPGWASLLTGVEPNRHNVDGGGNGDLQDISYDTVLKRVKDTFDGTTVAASVSWHPLIEDFFDYQDSSTLDGRHLADNDEDVIAQAETWIASGDYDLIFVDLDECDGAGHSYGFDGYANEYSAAVERMDEQVGRLLDSVLAHSQDLEYLIVLTTDHGGEGTSHGAQNPENRRIPFFVASNSPRVAIGTMPMDDTGSHMDLLPTVMHFLGGPDAIPSNLDGQVFGFKDYTRVKPPSCVSNPSTCACANDGSDYRGTISITKSGRTCQRWDSQFPHTHDRTTDDYPEAGLEENYCRNPDGENWSWCYTTDPNERWEVCTDVPRCGTTPTTAAPTTTTAAPTTTLVFPTTASPTKKIVSAPTSSPVIVVASPAPTTITTITPPTGACPGSDPLTCGCDNIIQKDYRGTINYVTTDDTNNTVECQAWDSQFPHTHSRTNDNYPGTGLEGNNYCRNPDNEPGGAWCYTTDPNRRWAYCNVPSC
mmetsp:Transcript_28957/g.43737  ORF Transcript_28957/g.43737 Transcript_28957/m.43737 type:complete len:611 (+) Transcript_28957:85-1917(+)